MLQQQPPQMQTVTQSQTIPVHQLTRVAIRLPTAQPQILQWAHQAAQQRPHHLQQIATVIHLLSQRRLQLIHPHQTKLEWVHLKRHVQSLSMAFLFMCGNLC